MNTNETRTDRYQMIVTMLRQIIDRLDVLERDVDDLDRVLRPYGDGHKDRRRRPS